MAERVCVVGVQTQPLTEDEEQQEQVNISFTCVSCVTGINLRLFPDGLF